jgi:hypothetical protein
MHISSETKLHFFNLCFPTSSYILIAPNPQILLDLLWTPHERALSFISAEQVSARHH